MASISISLNELAGKINAVVMGDESALIHSVSTLEEAGPGQVSFLSNPKYEKLLESTRASAVIVSNNIKSDRVTLLQTHDPHYAMMQAMVLLHGHRTHEHTGIHPDAHIDPSAQIGPGTTIYPGVYVGPRVKIGRDCILYPNAVIYHDSILGDRVIINAGSVIGNDGLGFATHKGVHHKIPQIGIAILEDDVEIGANVSIQRGALTNTIIGKGTKMGDLDCIGHAVQMGNDGMLVALIGIAGSTKIGHHVTMGGHVGIAGHLKIGDRVTIAAKAAVMTDCADGAVMYGVPAAPAPYGRKAAMLAAQLPDLADRIRDLEKKLQELETSQNNSEKT